MGALHGKTCFGRADEWLLRQPGYFRPQLPRQIPAPALMPVPTAVAAEGQAIYSLERIINALKIIRLACRRNPTIPGPG